VKPRADVTWADARHADGRKLRDVFGRFLTGVTVVTVYDAAGHPRGFTANSFTSVSLEPPLVLVCIANKAASRDTLSSASRFGVNILSESQRDISTRFALPLENKFEGVEIVGPPGSAPLLAGSLSCLDCALENVVEAGDHTIVIGRVLRFSTASGLPLGYYRGTYVAFGLGAEALERHGGDAIVLGCLLEHDGKVLLCHRPGRENWQIPTIALGSGENHRTLIPRLLRTLKVQATTPLLYSIYQDPGDPHMTMIFTAHVSEPLVAEPLADGTEVRLFSEAERPWERLSQSSPSSVVRRFFQERRSARFGIYWETEGGGRVASLEGEPRPWSDIPSDPES
jgi:flavin reductase (DIM6/NTAB) family NADH-FMN oxidoreductase RutF